MMSGEKYRGIKDHVGAGPALHNKLRTIITFRGKRAFKRLKTPADFISEIHRIESRISSQEGAVVRATALWQMEGLIREARIFDNGSFLLKEPSVAKHFPILHVGWGMDAFNEMAFDPTRFEAALGKWINPPFRLLAMEPVGMVYLASQQPLRSSLIGIRTLPMPGKEKLERFFSNFGHPEIQSMSHGFGRGVYFQARSLRSAVQKAMCCPPFFDPFRAVKGIAFAYAIVNSPLLDRVCFTAERLASDNPGSGEGRSFREGVVSALSFLEWNFPGFLEELKEIPLARVALDVCRSYQAAGGIYSF